MSDRKSTSETKVLKDFLAVKLTNNTPRDVLVRVLKVFFVYFSRIKHDFFLLFFILQTCVFFIFVLSLLIYLL